MNEPMLLQQYKYRAANNSPLENKQRTAGGPQVNNSTTRPTGAAGDESSCPRGTCTPSRG